MENEILISINSLKSILPAFENSILDKVQSIVTESSDVIEPLKDDIPSLYLTGKVPTSKDYVCGEIEYVSKTISFHAYTLISLQGNSTLAYPKKNFTINMYADENRSVALNKEFKNWGAHNNFVLKADYNDILRARNVVCAKLWSKVVESRPDYEELPEELRNSPNNGATDGFPVKVYIDGSYAGLYNFTIPKCDWMFGMNKKLNNNHIALCAKVNDNGDPALQYNPCNFNDEMSWQSIPEYWEEEVGNLGADNYSNLRGLILSVIDCDTEQLEQYLDIQSAIDYFIFQDVILGIDGLAKNMMLLTYNEGATWHLSAYDMDSTFDLHWQGYLMGASDSIQGQPPFLNEYSELLNLLCNNYWDQMKERYKELRKTVLSHASIMKEFEEYVGIYGDDLYIKDTAIYPDIPEATTNNLTYLSEFIKARLEFLDNEYGVEW